MSELQPQVPDLIDDLYDPNDDWRAQGECRGGDQRKWFPQRGESTKHAVKVCRACPVAERCLEYALENNIKHGIWGGKSERERRSLRRQRKLQS